MRRALFAWVTSRAFGASSITRRMLPVWSASSWVSQIHLSLSRSMTVLTAAMKSSVSIPIPVSMRTGSSAISRKALMGSTPTPGKDRLAGKTWTSRALWYGASMLASMGLAHGTGPLLRF